MPTPITPIEAAPQVPDSSQDEPIFDEAQENFYLWEKDKLAPGANAMAAATFTNATEAAASKEAAHASELAAAASALTSLGGSNFQGDWLALPGAPLNRPASVAHAGRIWLLLQDLENVALAEPSETSPYWQAQDVILPVVHVTTPTFTAIAGYHYSIEYAGQVTGTMPPLVEGSMVWITVANERRDTVLLRHAPTDSFMGRPPGDLKLLRLTTRCLRGINNSWRGL